ncbi:unnamed protein product [Gongylonema pulchrum]|uniref:MAGE domain-containing protein n=1 Tax=Gongylonema pulchrum TaxID=637853 RepID=A0A183EP61_9BILA|nr:unnamed protein product [Gongylonema pulchrum]
MGDLRSLKMAIVGIIGGEKNGCTEEKLLQLYSLVYHKPLEPSAYGFADMKSLLNSPEMQGSDGFEYHGGRYFVASNKKITRILGLVRGTRHRKKSYPERITGPRIGNFE